MTSVMKVCAITLLHYILHMHSCMCCNVCAKKKEKRFGCEERRWENKECCLCMHNDSLFYARTNMALARDVCREGGLPRAYGLSRGRAGPRWSFVPNNSWVYMAGDVQNDTICFAAIDCKARNQRQRALGGIEP